MKRKDIRPGTLFAQRTDYYNTNPIKRVGRIEGVDETTGTVDVMWLWPKQEPQTRALEPLWRQSTMWQTIPDPYCARLEEQLDLAMEAIVLNAKLNDLNAREEILMELAGRRRWWRRVWRLAGGWAR